MFKGYYDFSRFNYIHGQISNSSRFDVVNRELIPKTACFFSSDIDVYIDTSDGVNEDLEIHEYCGRMIKCISISRGKKFIFFKSSYSPVWSSNLDRMAKENNGKVIPFFKWSFNNGFYSYLLPNLPNLRKKIKEAADKKIDIGYFANPDRVYGYPKPSAVEPLVSCTDIKKFGLYDLYGPETANIEMMDNLSRPNTLSTLLDSDFRIWSGGLPYREYLDKSLECNSVFNPPGIGEYTSRVMDQAAIGNIVILRKNSYDQGHSWKDYFPEVDLKNPDWKNQIKSIFENRNEWQQKSLVYYENFWKPEKVFEYFVDHITREI